MMLTRKLSVLAVAFLCPVLLTAQEGGIEVNAPVKKSIKPLSSKIIDNLKFERDKRSEKEAQFMERQLITPDIRLELPEVDYKLLSETLQLDVESAKQASQLTEFIAKSEVESKSELETGRLKKMLSGPSQFDSRIELRQLNPLIPWQNSILNNATGVGMLVAKKMLSRVNDTLFNISTVSLKERYRLCPGEAFANQPVAGEATVFLIDSVRVMTAAHALQQELLSDYCVVFGFELLSKQGVFSSYINAANVYDLEGVVSMDSELDIGVMRLSRPSNHVPLVIANSFSYKEDQEVYMIGYPSGLPQKVALNAEILPGGGNLNFYTSLDAFQGNSGSPVFSRESNQVIGVLVSGMVDFNWTGSCNTVSICRYPYCRGEAVLRSDLISKMLANPTEKDK